MGIVKGFMEKYHGEIAPVHISILAFAGLWFPPNLPDGKVTLKRWLPYAAATTSSIFFVFMEMLGETGALLKLNNTAEGIGENASYVLVRVDVLVKLFQSVMYRKEWQDLETDMDAILKRHCLPSERKLVIEKVRKKSEGYLLRLLATMCFTGLGVVMQRTMLIWMGGVPDESHKLPVRFWILTPGLESPVYEMFVTIQVLSQIYTPFCLTALDSYTYVLAAYTAQTFQVLQKRLRSLPGRPEGQPMTDWTGLEARENFIQCVEFHHDLIRYSGRVNRAFRLNSFCTLSATMLQVTGLTLKLSAVPLASTKFFQGLLVCFVLEWKAWVVCSAGDMLVKESTAIATAIMESALWSAPNDIVQQCSLIIMRSQKAASYTAWKFFMLTPHVILDMMKLSYRIFTVLRSMV